VKRIILFVVNCFIIAACISTIKTAVFANGDIMLFEDDLSMKNTIDWVYGISDSAYVYQDGWMKLKENAVPNGMRLNTNREEPTQHVYGDAVYEVKFKANPTSISAENPFAAIRIKGNQDNFTTVGRTVQLQFYYVNNQYKARLLYPRGAEVGTGVVPLEGIDITEEHTIRLVAKGSDVTAYISQGEIERTLSINDGVPEGGTIIIHRTATVTEPYEMQVKDFKIYSLAALKGIRINDRQTPDFVPYITDIYAYKNLDGSKPDIEPIPFDSEAVISYDDSDENATVINVATEQGSVAYNVNYSDAPLSYELLWEINRLQGILDKTETEDLSAVEAMETVLQQALSIAENEDATEAEINEALEQLQGGALTFFETLYGKPKVENIKIEGKIGIGETLQAAYDLVYSGKFESVPHIYTWSRADKGSEVYKDILSAKENSYVLTSEDIGKSLKVTITPIVNVHGYLLHGDAYESDVVYGPSIPYIENLTIVGTAKVGETISAKYDYYHPNGYPETKSVCKWYRASGATGQFSFLAEGKYYKIDKYDENYYIMFEITPVTNVSPFEGVTVKSKAVRVTETGKSSSGGGGGGAYITKPVYAEPEIPTTPTAPLDEVKIFADITSHWAKSEIEFLATKHIVTGVDKDNFKPESNITRAEFLAITIRALGVGLSEYKNSFTDVAIGSWYAQEVQTAFDLNLVSGSGGAFRPNDAVTREEVTKIIVGAFRNAGGKIDAKQTDAYNMTFEDKSDISEWAEEFVSDAETLGLVKGVTNDMFMPKSNTTRAQAAVIIKRLLDIL